MNVMVLNPNSPETHWQDMYLLLLSQLNFDQPIALLLLPGSDHRGHWNEQQWRALSLYGLDQCHHLGTQPPITSQALTWQRAKDLLHPNGAPMLHLCHWQAGVDHTDWFNLAAEQDHLLMYGNIPSDCFDRWREQWPNPNCHIVFDGTHPHIAHSIKTTEAAALCLKHPHIMNWQ